MSYHHLGAVAVRAVKPGAGGPKSRQIPIVGQITTNVGLPPPPLVTGCGAIAKLDLDLADMVIESRYEAHMDDATIRGQLLARPGVKPEAVDRAFCIANAPELRARIEARYGVNAANGGVTKASGGGSNTGLIFVVVAAAVGFLLLRKR